MSKLPGMIEGVLAIDPSAPELEFAGRWQSWGELANASLALGRALDGLGLLSGARVGVLLRNRPEFVPVLSPVCKARTAWM